MSRTLRRNNKHQIRRYCGMLENIDDWHRRRYGGNTVEETYVRRKHWYTRDHHSGIFSVPGWFVNLFYNRPHRRSEKQKLHNHLQCDDWDNHLPEKRQRGAYYHWF